ncbi:uncharacterized protein [Aegilops tauschii subsp. strangulata]|uniref:uncharacterized protein n=1 Tax=Aegilops tauschii subsp. strangulata TaxID=200361 RepID=UPI00098B3904|nr:uncharacterized protein LOC109775300 [Aegilops tauschii subsp. strangulata]
MLHGSRAGVVLVSPKGDRINYVLQIHFDSSNNEAEYEALLYGLRMAISLRVSRLMVNGDSSLVVNQVMKEWDILSPTMIGYYNAVRKLEKNFEGLELHHIPRLKNQAADDLAKIGSTRKAVPKNMFVEHLHSPTIKEYPFMEEPPQPVAPSDSTEVDIPAVIYLVQEILVTTPEWTEPYIAYLLGQELPENEVEARQIVHRSKAFTIMGDQLYKKNTSGVTQHCISLEEGQQILQEIHSGTCGHHASSRMLVAKAFQQASIGPALTMIPET